MHRLTVWLGSGGGEGDGVGVGEADLTESLGEHNGIVTTLDLLSLAFTDNSEKSSGAVGSLISLGIWELLFTDLLTFTVVDWPEFEPILVAPLELD